MKKILLFIFTVLVLSGMIAAQSITVTSPNGGENWKLGSTHNVTWTSSGISGKVGVKLFKNGNSLGYIAMNIPVSSGRFSWKISKSGLIGGGVILSGSNYKIQVKQSGVTGDLSNGNFTISAASSFPAATAVLAKKALKEKAEGYQLSRLKPIITSVTPSYYGNYIEFNVGGKFFRNNQGTQKIFMLARRSPRQFPLEVLSWSNNLIVCKTSHMVEWEPFQKFFIYDSVNPPADGSMQNSNIFVYKLKTKIYFPKEIAVNSLPKVRTGIRINKIRSLRGSNSPVNIQNTFTIYGSMLGPQHPDKKVYVTGVVAPIVSWSNTKVVFRLPSSLNKTIRNFVYLKTYYEIPYIFSNKLLLPKIN